MTVDPLDIARFSMSSVVNIKSRRLFTIRLDYSVINKTLIRSILDSTCFRSSEYLKRTGPLSQRLLIANRAEFGISLPLQKSWMNKPLLGEQRQFQVVTAATCYVRY